MKNLEEIMEWISGSHILEDLKDLLRTHDPDFKKSEEECQTAAQTLRDAGFGSALDEHLAAQNEDLISQLMVAGYLGAKTNLANFRSPTGVQFLHLDFVDELKGHIIGSFPANGRANQLATSFYKSLPEDLQEVEGAISRHYIDMEVPGVKLAHYAGYLIANHFLPLVEPGYRADLSQTIAYGREIREYLGYWPFMGW